MSNQPKVGRHKSKKRQQNRSEDVEKEKLPAKQVQLVESSTPEKHGCSSLNEEDRLQQKGTLIKNTPQNTAKQTTISKLQITNKDFESTDPQLSSKSKSNSNLCTNIPYKERNEVNQSKRNVLNAESRTKAEIRVTQDNSSVTSLPENKLDSVKIEGMSTTTDSPVLHRCTNSDKPARSDDKITSSSNIVKDENTAQRSKSELRAERRALQEAQRAAKQSKKSGNQEISKSAHIQDIKCNETISTIQAKAGVKIVEKSECINVNIEGGISKTDQRVPQGDGVAEKSKAELRAQRRALQEAQRAAKQAKKQENEAPSVTVKKSHSNIQESKVVVDSGKSATSLVSKDIKLPSTKQVKLFKHLTPYQGNISIIGAAKEEIHSSVIQLGLQYASGVVCGSNARCTALIESLIEVVKDFSTPAGKDFSHALNLKGIEPSMKFLGTCRPVSVGMQVISKKLMEYVASLSKDLPERDAKLQVEQFLKQFLEEDIITAHKAISQFAKEKITDNDVILTYSCSYLVKKVLSEAYQKAKFRVIVVDARPKLEGKSMFHYLIQQGIECTYVLINAIAHVMPQATKVFLGAHAVLANGYVMSRVGSSQVALVAKAFNKPVLVCCETYKFSELVQTDSFVFNELGNPNELVDIHQQGNPLSEWQDLKFLNILNLYYDVTPPDLVTVIINDRHLVPCTSVPVLLRVKPTKK